MDLLEKASIILTPTAYNNGEALCVKPSDGSGDFDFSRNSAATRVNAQGLVENVQILSSNLVQNPSFSEEGVQEVSNGSFSQEGSEEITNGDFSSDTDWTKGTGWSISGGAANCDGTQTANSLIYQSGVLASANSFKCEITISDYQSGVLRFVLGGGGSEQSYSANGTYTFYGTKGSDNNLYLSANSDFIGSIDNCSVREVGQDWTLGTGWSIGEDKAVAVSGTSSRLEQSISGLSGKTCKISFTLSDYGGSGAVYVDFGSVNSDLINTNGEHVVYGTFDQDEFELFKGGSFSGSITNISVKEVGMDWVFSGGAEITGQGARINNTITGANAYINQVNSNLTIGKSLVFQYDVVQTNGKDLAIEQIGGNISLNTSTIGNNRKVYFEFDRADANLIIKRAAAATDVTITNISVIEITDDTNLPRINYEGFSYQDALGSELVTNGDFATDSYWNLAGGATISDGKANITGDGSAFTNISQGGIFTSGKQYVVKADVVINSGLGIKFQDGATNENIGFATTSGTYTFNFTATANSTLMIARRTGGTAFDSSIDNVSVKEYLGQIPIPNSGCGSWLFEPQSTNLITYSEDFSQWTLGSNSTLTFESDVVAPDGSLGVYKLTLPAISDTYILSPSFSNSNPLAVSIYAKSTENGNNDFEFFTGGTSISDIKTATSEWKRFDYIANGSSLAIINSNDAYETDIYIWGAQAENQSYATSYIPTNGEPNGVTRNQDVCTNGATGTGLINSTEGVLYAEIAALSNDGTNREISINNGTTNDRVQILLAPASNELLIFYKAQSGATQFTMSETLADATEFNKIAFKWKANDFALWVNGTERDTISSGVTSNVGVLTKIDFDQFNGGTKFFGKTKALAVWKEALSDEELQSLTTI